jgi:hypothetical protein
MGSIALAPTDGTPGPGGGGVISEGKYEIKRGLQPGKYRVEIRSTIALSRPVRNATIPSEIVKEEVSVIPEEYKTKSNLFEVVGQAQTYWISSSKGPRRSKVAPFL